MLDPPGTHPNHRTSGSGPGALGFRIVLGSQRPGAREVGRLGTTGLDRTAPDDWAGPQLGGWWMNRLGASGKGSNMVNPNQSRSRSSPAK